MEATHRLSLFLLGNGVGKPAFNLSTEVGKFPERPKLEGKRVCGSTALRYGAKQMMKGEAQ